MYLDGVKPRCIIIGNKAQYVLRVQFGAELLDRFLEAFEARERQQGAAGALCKRLRGVRLSKPAEFAQGGFEIDALVRLE
jgi:hypothetical protein